MQAAAAQQLTEMLLCMPGKAFTNAVLSALWLPDDLLLQEMELMVFFEGIDAMTSNSVQVMATDWLPRQAYQ
jgi:hypothetical protein